MATRVTLKSWILEALDDSGGSATIIQVAKHIWSKHEAELRSSGDLFYTWQYDMRWAARELRVERRLMPKRPGDRGPWRLA